MDKEQHIQISQMSQDLFGSSQFWNMKLEDLSESFSESHALHDNSEKSNQPNFFNKLHITYSVAHSQKSRKSSQKNEMESDCLGSSVLSKTKGKTLEDSMNMKEMRVQSSQHLNHSSPRCKHVQSEFDNSQLMNEKKRSQSIKASTVPSNTLATKTQSLGVSQNKEIGNLITNFNTSKQVEELPGMKQSEIRYFKKSQISTQSREIMSSIKNPKNLELPNIKENSQKTNSFFISKSSNPNPNRNSNSLSQMRFKAPRDFEQSKTEKCLNYMQKSKKTKNSNPTEKNLNLHPTIFKINSECLMRKSNSFTRSKQMQLRLVSSENKKNCEYQGDHIQNYQEPFQFQKSNFKDKFLAVPGKKKGYTLGPRKEFFNKQKYVEQKRSRAQGMNQSQMQPLMFPRQQTEPGIQESSCKGKSMPMITKISEKDASCTPIMNMAQFDTSIQMFRHEDQLSMDSMAKNYFNEQRPGMGRDHICLDNFPNAFLGKRGNYGDNSLASYQKQNSNNISGQTDLNSFSKNSMFQSKMDSQLSIKNDGLLGMQKNLGLLLNGSEMTSMGFENNFCNFWDNPINKSQNSMGFHSKLPLDKPNEFNMMTKSGGYAWKGKEMDSELENSYRERNYQIRQDLDRSKKAAPLHKLESIIENPLCDKKSDN